MGVDVLNRVRCLEEELLEKLFAGEEWQHLHLFDYRGVATALFWTRKTPAAVWLAEEWPKYGCAAAICCDWYFEDYPDIPRGSDADPVFVGRTIFESEAAPWSVPDYPWTEPEAKFWSDELARLAAQRRDPEPDAVRSAKRDQAWKEHLAKHGWQGAPGRYFNE